MWFVGVALGHLKFSAQRHGKWAPNMSYIFAYTTPEHMSQVTITLTCFVLMVIVVQAKPAWLTALRH